MKKRAFKIISYFPQKRSEPPLRSRHSGLRCPVDEFMFTRPSN